MERIALSRKEPLENQKVQEIMTRNIIVVNADDPLPFVIKLFERTRISGAPVVDHTGKYIGVISKTDLARVEVLKSLVQNYQSTGLDALSIRHFMNPSPPITVSLNCTVKQASELMVKKHVHRVFVADNEKNIIGVISSFDIVKSFAHSEIASQEEPTVFQLKKAGR